jgi:hypothetical protein
VVFGLGNVVFGMSIFGLRECASVAHFLFGVEGTDEDSDGGGDGGGGSADG